jgi:hypothetical protein
MIFCNFYTYYSHLIDIINNIIVIYLGLLLNHLKFIKLSVDVLK